MKATPEVRLIAETRLLRPYYKGVNLPWSAWDTDVDAADSGELSEFAGRLCYQSWKKPNPETATNYGYLKHILASQHYSVLEHGGFTVAVIGASRAFSHEIVRHRHLSFSQLSQRFFDESSARYIVPPLFEGNDRAEAVLEEFHQAALSAYKSLIEIGKGIVDRRKGTEALWDSIWRRKRVREAARAVLPNNIETQIVITGNHRAWREVFEKRGTRHADAEIRGIVLGIFAIARDLAPAIYQDMKVGEDGGVTVIQHAASDQDA